MNGVLRFMAGMRLGDLEDSSTRHKYSDHCYEKKILQLAIEARVPYVVTRNVRDFDGAGRFGIGLIPPADFLKLIRQPQP